MTRLTILIMSIFAVITTAWAGDSWVDYPTCPDDGKAYEYQAETHELNPSIPENVLPTNEITDILERCLEFVEDQSADDTVTLSPLVYYPQSPLSRMRDEVKAMERETALRREIEKALRILKGEK